MKTRVVKKASIRRDEILDSASRLIFSKGFEQMTIQDILDDLSIAKGTVYHYFDSKLSLLEAFIERIQLETEKQLLPILQDPGRNAVEKLQGFFNALDTLRAANMPEIARLARVWYSDDNAVVRNKIDAAVVKQRAPLLNAIVQQGMQEGVFHTPHPDHSGEIILALLQGMGSAHMRLLLSLDTAPDEAAVITAIVTTQAAYMEAIERVLGAAPESLYRINVQAVQGWAAAFKQTA